MERKRRDIVLKGKEEKYENVNDQRDPPLSFFFFFFFFCLSLFETTEICLGCTKMEISIMGEIFFSNFAHPFDCHTWLPPCLLWKTCMIKCKTRLKKCNFLQFSYMDSWTLWQKWCNWVKTQISQRCWYDMFWGTFSSLCFSLYQFLKKKLYKK